MTTLLNRIHARVGDLWWYSLMIFVACRSGDVIQAFIGLWLVPKYVGPNELGAVLPLQQLSNLFAVPLAIIATVFAKYVNTYATRGELGKVKSFICDILIITCGIFLICIIVAYLLIPHFYERLNIASGMLTTLILASGLSANMASLFSSALQGLKKFNTMTIQNLIGAPIRLITLLIAMPFRPLSGYIIGQTTPPAACSFLAYLSLHQDLKSIPSDNSWRRDIREILRYTWPIAIYMVLGSLTSTIGMTVYRQRLPEIESAAYYLLSRFAEISGYLGLSMTAVLIPLASEAHEQGNEQPTFIRNTVFSTLGISTLLALAFTFWGRTILSANREWANYLTFSHLLPILTISTGMGMTKLAFISYEMACRRFTSTIFVTIASVIWTASIVCLTGYSFFYGILPVKFVDWMGSLQVARFSLLTYIGLGAEAAQLLVLALIHKHCQRTHKSFSCKSTAS